MSNSNRQAREAFLAEEKATPVIHFGAIQEPIPAEEWPEDEDPDDEELPYPPRDVEAVLGTRIDDLPWEEDDL
jgi:hypothetical protein